MQVTIRPNTDLASFPYLDKYKLTPLVGVLDIETHGRREDAIIASVGCVVINVFTGEVMGTFYARCITETQHKRSWSRDVMDFWQEQKTKSPVAFDEVFNTKLERWPLKVVLEQLSQFICAVIPYNPQIMGNGSEFDNMIVSHAYENEGVTQPWNFGGNQSLRTAVWLGRLLLDIDPKYQAFEGVRHHALDDAKHEAHVLFSIVSAFVNAIKAKESV
ncbi:MAG: 3'-5' exonuclease [Shewanella sp.]